MEAPGGEPGHPHTGWVRDYMGEEQFRYKLEEIEEAESLLLGRVTYESFASAWPQRSGGGRLEDADLARVADQRSGIERMADKMNSMPKHVVSTTLREPAWSNTTVIAGDVAASIGRLKAGEGGPILVAGSRTLVHALVEHDLVDEYRLMVIPVLVGSGARLFPESERKRVLRLADVRALGSGVLVQTYRPA
jgi:dihydrofolate reductase